jgi:quinoprotein glucose dehydrogenase
MLTSTTRRARFRASWIGVILMGSGAMLSNCGPRPTGAGGAPQPAEDEHVVRLAAADARELADAIRQSSSAEAVDGLDLRLWASDPLVADPIAISIDHQGRLYYTRSERRGSASLDIRGHPGWMIESLSFRTVEDRRRFLHRELAPERSSENQWLEDLNRDGSHDWRDLTVGQEFVYRLEDSSGDGLADVSRRVFSGFDTETSDVALGVLAHRDDLFVSVAPDLWRLRDTTRDGVPDRQESISHGYAVHIGFGGHGLSGVTLGPDGRVYWAIGDYGLDVTDREGRRWSLPYQGAILRSELDGTGFEVFATGLRNTHEFAFDEYGNLISVDNDGDHPGERERIVYLVDGSDSGWRITWQFGKYRDPENNSYNPWLAERQHAPRFEGQAAHIVPPIAAYHTGPTGMVYNPGTALGPEWRNHFVVAHFTGSAATSRLHAFQLQPSGAGFELARDTVLMRGILATGLEFGPDGALYIADWDEGWSPNGQGRIWKLDSPIDSASALRTETRTLLAETFTRRPERDLATLLRHADMRVRLKAQLELVDRSAVRTLRAAAHRPDHQLARLHAIWGIGQLARQDQRQATALTALLSDPDHEVRAQAARVIGDVRFAPAADALIPLLADASGRVRFFAAEALGRIAHPGAVPSLVSMLEANADRDVYLRHAGSTALARIGDADAVVALAQHPSRAVRIGAVVALRRMQHPGIAIFLEDDDEYLVTEAARAINDDEGIDAALPALARLLAQDRFANEALIRRAISANVRIGTAESVRRLAAYAARADAPEPLRVEAMAAAGSWPAPSVLDRVDGTYRGVERRDPQLARAALEPVLAPVLRDGPVALRVATVEAAARVRLQTAEPVLLDLLRRDPAPEVRTAALRALQAVGAAHMEEAVRVAMSDGTSAVRMTAIGLIPTLPLDAAAAAELLTSAIRAGSVEERQSAVQALGELRTPEANRALGGLMQRLESGTLPPEIQLETFQAVEAGGSPELAARLALFRERRAREKTLGQFAEALRGGNAARGQRIAFESVAGQCTRCHSFDEQQVDVGPNLSAIGSVLSREQLLEALVDPSARIAPGYGSVTVVLRGGETLSGPLLDKSEAHLVLHTREGPRRIATADIEERTNTPSAMPPMGHLLSRSELRDLVEYMTTLRGSGSGPRRR